MRVTTLVARRYSSISPESWAQRVKLLQPPRQLRRLIYLARLPKGVLLKHTIFPGLALSPLFFVSLSLCAVTLRSWRDFAPIMSLPRLLPALAIIFTSLTFVATASPSDTCYWPDGTVAVNRVPCESIPGQETWCCEDSSVCTTGGYCLGNAGVFSRGGCTDQTWQSNFCPQLCAHGAVFPLASHVRGPILGEIF